MSLVDLLLEIRDKEIKYFRNYLEYAKKIRNSAREILSDSGLRVLIFGSIVRGNYLVGRSDIDILIISNNVPNSLRVQTKIRLEILRKLGDYLLHLRYISLPGEYLKNGMGDLSKMII